MTAIAGSVGWLAGLLYGQALPALSLALAAAMVGALLGLAMLWRRTPWIRLGAAGLALALVAVLRVQSSPFEPTPDSIAGWSGHGEVEIHARIVGEPERTDAGVRARMAAMVVYVGPRRDARATTTGDLVAVLPHGDWQYGDHVALVGRIERPVDRDDVPMAEVLGRQRIWATVRGTAASRLPDADAPAVRRVEAAAWRALYAVKSAAGAALDRWLPSTTAALARGLLLGGTVGMPPDMVEAFRRAGMSHIVAVSGYNVALIAGAVLAVGRLGPGRAPGTLLLPMLAVWLFTLLVGAPPSALRASFMGCLALLARYIGRPADATAGLAIAAVAMTMLEPGLLWDLGFQLSSLATLALVAVYPWMSSRLPGGDATVTAPAAGLGATVLRGGRELLLATLAVELLTTPLIGVQFGRVAVLSPVANVLALPAVPPAMVTSVLVIAAGMLPAALSPLAAGLGWLAWVPLAWIVGVVEACAAPDWAALPLGGLEAMLAWGYYGLAAGLLLSLHHRSYRGSLPSPVGLLERTLRLLPAPMAIGAALLAAVAAWGGAASAQGGSMRLTFFEASGATLVRTSGDRVVLISESASGRALAADLARTLPFYASAIDLLVLANGDASESVPELLRRHTVRQIAAPAGMTGDEPSRWRQAADAAGVTVLSPPTGAEVPLGEGGWLKVVENDDGYGVLVVGEAGRVLVLGGSLRPPGSRLMEAIDGPVSVVRVGAVGAAALASLREALDPRLLLVQIPPNPSRALELPRDASWQVLRSDDYGTIELTMRGSNLELRSRRTP